MHLSPRSYHLGALARPARLAGLVLLTLGLIFPIQESLAGQTVAQAASGPTRIFLPAISNASGTMVPQASLPLTEENFALQVNNGDASTIRGVFVADVLALQVVQQPPGSSGYVSSQPGVATQFALAEVYGVTGLLAHNTAAGKDFFNLKTGQEVAVIFGDGARSHYRVVEIHEYQALQPSSAASDFVDLQTGEVLTAGKLFSRMYMGSDHVTFQTCISRDGISSWGRLFVTAQPE